MQDHARQFSDVLRREQEAMQQVFFFSSFSFFFYSSFRDLHRRAPPVRTGGHAAGFFIIYIYMYTHTHIHRYIYINICYIYKQIKVPGFVDVAPGTSDADTLHMQAIFFVFLGFVAPVLMVPRTPKKPTTSTCARNGSLV